MGKFEIKSIGVIITVMILLNFSHAESTDSVLCDIKCGLKCAFAAINEELHERCLRHCNEHCHASDSVNSCITDCHLTMSNAINNGMY